MEAAEKIIRVYELARPVFERLVALEEEVICEFECHMAFQDERFAFMHMFGELTCDLNYYHWEVMPYSDNYYHYFNKYKWFFLKKEIREFFDNLVLSNMFD